MKLEFATRSCKVHRLQDCQLGSLAVLSLAVLALRAHRRMALPAGAFITAAMYTAAYVGAALHACDNSGAKPRNDSLCNDMANCGCTGPGTAAHWEAQPAGVAQGAAAALRTCPLPQPTATSLVVESFVFAGGRANQCFMGNAVVTYITYDPKATTRSSANLMISCHIMAVRALFSTVLNTLRIVQQS
jgi:hypothetical protein